MVPMKPSARTPENASRVESSIAWTSSAFDYELWAFANNLFDERMVRLKNSPDGVPSLPERRSTDLPTAPP